MAEKQNLAWPAAEMADLVRKAPEMRTLVDLLERLFRSVSDANRTDVVYDLTNLASGQAAPTGTQTRTTFNPSTVTLEELAERVAAHFADHKALED